MYRWQDDVALSHDASAIIVTADHLFWVTSRTSLSAVRLTVSFFLWPLLSVGCPLISGGKGGRRLEPVGTLLLTIGA